MKRLRMLAAVLFVGLLVVQTNAEFPVGRFAGAIKSGNIGGSLDGDYYTFLVSVSVEGDVNATLPEFDCGSNQKLAVSALRNNKIEFTYINGFGGCIDSEITLTHVDGPEWRLEWINEDTNQYGVGRTFLECSNQCELGFRCNSVLTNSGPSLGECIPLGNLAIGEFVGSLANGATATIGFLNRYSRKSSASGVGITAAFGSSRSSGVIQPIVFSPNRFTFLYVGRNQHAYWYCGLTHQSGTEWQIDCERGSGSDSGVVEFECFNSYNDCEQPRERCLSTFSVAGVVGDCETFDSVDEQNAYVNSHVDCPLESVALSDSSSGASVRLSIYFSRKFYFLSSGGIYGDKSYSKDPYQVILSGNEIAMNGFRGCNEFQAVQLQGDAVCISYEFVKDEEKSCKSECIKIGESKTIEVIDKFKSLVGGRFLIDGESCQVVVEQLQPDAPAQTIAPVPAPTTDAPVPSPTGALSSAQTIAPFPAPTTDAPVLSPTTDAPVSLTGTQQAEETSSIAPVPAPTTDAPVPSPTSALSSAQTIAPFPAPTTDAPVLSPTTDAPVPLMGTPQAEETSSIAPVPAPTTDAPVPSPTGALSSAQTIAPFPAPTTDAPVLSPTTDAPVPLTGTPQAEETSSSLSISMIKSCLWIATFVIFA